MNWKRGLFRAWLMLSICWVALTAYIFLDQLLEIVTPVDPPTGVGGIALPPGQYECWGSRHLDNPFVADPRAGEAGGRKRGKFPSLSTAFQ